MTTTKGILLREHNDIVETITENVNGQQQQYIQGVFMQAETKNKNQRVYPKQILGEAVRQYSNEYVTTGRAMGELMHPESSPQINLDRVSHRITELVEDGNNIHGRALILDTPAGQIAKGLLNGGVKLGVSSRGVGGVQNGIVQEGFRLATVDIVADPSAPNAFVESLMEGSAWVYENGIWQEDYLEKAVKRVRKVSKSDIQRVFVEEFQRALNNIATKH